jgi:hypothetical protein
MKITQAKNDYYVLFFYPLAFALCWIATAINRLLLSFNIHNTVLEFLNITGPNMNGFFNTIIYGIMTYK